MSGFSLPLFYKIHFQCCAVRICASSRKTIQSLKYSLKTRTLELSKLRLDKISGVREEALNPAFGNVFARTKIPTAKAFDHFLTITLCPMRARPGQGHIQVIEPHRFMRKPAFSFDKRKTANFTPIKIDFHNVPLQMPRNSNAA